MLTTLFVVGVCGFLFLVFGVLGGLLIRVGLSERRSGRASRNWPKAGAKILSSRVEKRHTPATMRQRSHDTYAPVIRYAYRAAGRSWESDRIRFGEDASGARRWAERLAARYPPGSTAIVRYDPAEPSTAVLEEGWKSSWLTYGIMFVAVGALVPGAILWLFLLSRA
jgi:hypothetical protein